MKEYEGTEHRELHLKKGTPKEMEAFRQKWKLKLKVEKLRKVKVLTISAIIAAAFLFGLVKLFEDIFN